MNYEKDLTLKQILTLKTLEEKERYGLEIMAAINDCFIDRASYTGSTLYPTLDSLEALGYIEKIGTRGKNRRNYIKITASGLEKLKVWEKAFSELPSYIPQNLL